MDWWAREEKSTAKIKVSATNTSVYAISSLLILKRRLHLMFERI